MTSKSFKGLLSANELNVVGYGDSSQVDLLIRRSDRAITSTGIAIAPSDVPALALAILEAAGYKEEQGNETTEAAHHFGMSMLHLRFGIKEQEYITAEAEAEAKLEAEAETLYRVYFETAGVDYKNWNKSEQRVKDYWLAVARKAREIGAEK